MKQLILILLGTSTFFMIGCGNTGTQEKKQADEEATEEMYDDEDEDDTMEYESILDTLYEDSDTTDLN